MRAHFQFICVPPLARLRLAGEFDLAASDRLTQVFDCFAARGCRCIELDAEDVTFIDARCLRAIALEQERLRRSGGHLSIVATSVIFELIARLADYDTLRLHPEYAT